MSIQETAPDHRAAGQTIEVADENLEFRQVAIHDATPTGAQISRAAGFTPASRRWFCSSCPTAAWRTSCPSQIVDLRWATAVSSSSSRPIASSS